MPASLATSRSVYAPPTTAALPSPHAAGGPSARRVTELDGLRGVAIALVLLLHFVVRSPFGSGLYALAPHLSSLLDLSWCGVDLFFVISGFLIGGILLDHRGSPSLKKTFYLRRACRILPLYAALIALAFTPLIEQPAPASSGNVPWYAYALFIHNYWTSRGVTASYWLGPAWSIAIEEQFYLLAPFIIPLLSLRELRRVLVACIILAPVLRYLAMKSILPVSMWDFTLCRLDAPAMGVLGALLLRDPRTKTAMERLLPTLRRALPFVLLGVALVSQLALVRRSFNGDLVLFTLGLSWLALAALVTVLVVSGDPTSGGARASRTGWLVYLGRRSYFVYLFHMPALRSVIHWGPSSEPLCGVMALVLTLGFAELSWRHVEAPILRLGHRLSYGSAPA